MPAIAGELGCSQKTVRCWLHRFNHSGLQGLDDLGGQGRKRRITEDERSRIISLVKTVPPGRLRWEPVGELWAFDESRAARVDAGFAGRGCAERGDRGGPLAGAPHPARGRGEVASHPVVDAVEGPGLRPKRTRIIGLYTQPPDGATVICADELGPAVPRTFPPAPAWSPDGHRIKAELDYSRGPEKTWVYGGLRPADGQALTMTASSRNSVFYQQFLQQLGDANPTGQIWIVTDNLSSHNSLSTRTWLKDHPRIHHAFIVGACWLNLQEGWWRIFRKAALAGRSFANPDDIAYSTTLATSHSTPARSHGSGADRHPQPDDCDADIRISNEESSTSTTTVFGLMVGQFLVVCGRGVCSG
ncbi:transposase [Streptomyces sp. NPDC055109]